MPHLLDKRFEVGKQVGAGAMGAVYQAWDRVAEAQVAIKVLHTLGANNVERFALEADVLAQLSHPRIVRYIAHGETEEGEPYLAMEWLKGETLDERLARQKLTITDAVRVGTRVAEGLVAAHLAGVAHRDIKPANLFLVDGDVDSVMLTDFGVARRAQDDLRLTKTGLLVGTPVYMSPEQARGERTVDARSDIWSLGCVLFECVTGRSPFRGETLMAILAKILVEPAPTLREVAPNVPQAMSSVIERMLSREEAERPTAAELIARFEDVSKQLSAIDAFATMAPASLPSRSTTFSHGWGSGRREQRVVCALFIASEVEGAGSGRAPGVLDALRSSAAQMESMLDGSSVVTWGVNLAPKEQVLQAAQCARLLLPLYPGSRFVLCTGRAVIERGYPLGDLIDRASRLLDQTPPGVIRVDPTSGGLLDGRFEVRGEAPSLSLGEERSSQESPRTLLGKVRSHTGRELDLETLQNVFRDCEEESAARAVLVSAAAGMGKSRLCYEFLQRIRQDHAQFHVLVGRGDPVRVGAPFGLLSPVVRGWAGLGPGDDPKAQEQKLRARAIETLGNRAEAALPFLAELASVMLPAERNALYDSCKQDPRLMGDHLLAVWLDLLESLSHEKTLLLLIEDLHWGDMPSVQFLDAALRNFHDRPVMVLALARPEVNDLFPSLFRDRNLFTMRLSPINRRAAEKFVQEVLGSRVGEGQRKRIVEQAEGNALYLEELIRAAAAAEGESVLPDSVLGMVQARLDGLGEEAKRLLSVGSVFGQTFPKEGIISILSGESSQVALEQNLSYLVDREVLFVRGTKGSEDYVFRHALIREGAYLLLTEDDLGVAHTLAGELLAERQDAPPKVIAEHFERGHDKGSAASWYAKAAEQALAAEDLSGVIVCADKALACGADRTVLGDLAWFKAEAHQWRGENELSAHASEEARHYLATGSGLWFRATGTLCMASARMGDSERAEEAAGELLSRAAMNRLERPHILGMAGAASNLAFNNPDMADALLSFVRAQQFFLESDPMAHGWVYFAETNLAEMRGELMHALQCAERSHECMVQAGDLRGTCSTLANAGTVLMALGALQRSESMLREAQTLAHRMGLLLPEAEIAAALGTVLGWTGRGKEGLSLCRTAVALASGAWIEGACRTSLARVLIAEGALDEAEREARLGLDALQAHPNERALAQAVLAQVFLTIEKREDAARLAASAMSCLQSGGAMTGASYVRLVHCEATLVTAGLGAAGPLVRSAVRHLMEQAEHISDQEMRRSFLEQIPHHARTMALSHEVGDAKGTARPRSSVA